MKILGTITVILGVVFLSASAPIGVFDSGVGGLSVLKEIRELLPRENFIYLADEAYCPYGTKNLSEIQERVFQITNFLIEKGVKMVVVACNSACAAGLDQVRERVPSDFPIVGVEPAIKMAHDVTKNGKVGILATAMTLNGERFLGLVERYARDIQIFSCPASGLAPLVESGKFSGEEAEKLLLEYLQPMLNENIDTLVLGCTHYPFLRKEIEKICGSKVTVLDTGIPVARQVQRLLEAEGNLNTQETAGNEMFFTTGEETENITKVIRLLWHNQVEVSLAK